MYTPKVNKEEDVSILQQCMQDHPLCALVTQTAQGMIATHLPMVFVEDGSPYGVLRGHIARENLQWTDTLPESEALAIFSGPEHYISASWYPGKKEHGREVPTWNYVVVHAYAPLRIIQDAHWLLEHLSELTDRNESIADVPWKVSDAPPEFIKRLTGAIVGIELQISRLEGKWKVSQNRNDKDRAAVMTGLETVGTPEANTMKQLISAKRQGPQTP